jgi:tetratricopeptide (TPR) repeat protein
MTLPPPDLSKNNPTTLLEYLNRGPLAIAIIVGLALLAYSNIFHAAFVFDDFDSIHENESIRWVSPYWQVLTPPYGVAVQNRPVVNVSLAINYALGGLKPNSYQAFNLFIHMANALLIYSLIRAVVRHYPLARSLRPQAGWLALITAVLWVVHPLNTEGVTAIIQRTESMMAFFVLLMFVAAWKAHFATGHRRSVWTGLAAVCCILGAGCKEAMALAPILLVLFDRTFLYTSWRQLLRDRVWLYAGLVLGWVALAGIVISTGGNRGNAAGFGFGMEWYHYLRTQVIAIWLYLKLMFWPTPLIGDYGYPIENNPWRYWSAGIALGLLGLAGLACWKKAPWVAFVTLMFFMILAPSSSIVPLVNQTIAEKRMYFPSLMVIVVVVFGVYWLLQRFGHVARWQRFGKLGAGMLILLVVSLLSMQTWLRNRVYVDNLTYWGDNATKAPFNHRNWVNYAGCLNNVGRREEALTAADKALELQSDYHLGHAMRGTILYNLNRNDEAMKEFQTTIHEFPWHEKSYYYLGQIAMLNKDYRDAVILFNHTLELRPTYIQVYLDVAWAHFYNDEIELANGSLVVYERLAQSEQPSVHILFTEKWKAKAARAATQAASQPATATSRP